MKKYYKINGDEVSLIPYIIDKLKSNIVESIHVGSDSQNIGRKTTIVTVVAFRYGIGNDNSNGNLIGKGVHYIFNKSRVKKIRNVEERLLIEVENSINLSLWIREHIPTIKLQIDMDINSDEHHLSNKLVSQAKGWGEGLGFIVNIKPDNQIATRAADYHCR
jgi:predicted RNase H-related nuclease YkuK (DUF458 family)